MGMANIGTIVDTRNNEVWQLFKQFVET